MNAMHQKQLFGLHDLALMTTCFFWGLGAVVVKSAIGSGPEDFRIFVFNGIRMPITSLILFTVVRARGGSIAIRRKDVGYFALVSFVGMFLHITSSLIGLSLSSASNMGVIVATIPLFILVTSIVTRSEPFNIQLLAGVLIGMSGVLALSVEDGGVHFNPGDLLLLASCFFWGLYTVLSKRLVRDYRPLVAIAWVFLFAALYQSPLFLYQLREQTWTEIALVNWLNLFIATFGSYALANTLFFYGIREIGAIKTGIYTNLTPVFTITLAWLLRGEEVSALKIAGLGIILCGIAITKLPVRNRKVIENLQA